MKITSSPFRFFILGITSSILFSCSKPESPEPSGEMKATVDGAEWQSVTTSAIITNNSIAIVGLNKDNDVLELDVLKSAASGSYDVTGGDVSSLSAAISLSPNTGAGYVSSYYANGVKVGTITISEIDDVTKTLSGTFN